MRDDDDDDDHPQSSPISAEKEEKNEKDSEGAGKALADEFLRNAIKMVVDGVHSRSNHSVLWMEEQRFKRVALTLTVTLTLVLTGPWRARSGRA